MKLLILIAMAVCLLALSTPCWAGEPVINHVMDSLSGHNDYLETRGYAAVTVDLEKVPFVNILNADLRVKISTPIGEGSFESGVLETGLEWEF